MTVFSKDEGICCVKDFQVHIFTMNLYIFNYNVLLRKFKGNIDWLKCSSIMFLMFVFLMSKHQKGYAGSAMNYQWAITFITAWSFCRVCRGFIIGEQVILFVKWDDRLDIRVAHINGVSVKKWRGTFIWYFIIHKSLIDTCKRQGFLSLLSPSLIFLRFSHYSTFVQKDFASCAVVQAVVL